MINSKDEFNAMMIELFEDVVSSNSDEDYADKSISFSDRAKKLISVMAEYARTLELYNDLMDNNVVQAERAEYIELVKTKSASLIWLDMCYKISNAPTSFHMECVPVLLIPVLDDKLRREVNE